MRNCPPIPLFSAEAANASFDLSAVVERVLRSHRYVLGQEVDGFEGEFARYIGVDHCISLANGTDALELGLRALGVKLGDLVVCVANAGFYGSAAVYAIGAQPLYVDVDEATLTMSPAALAQVLPQKPSAVIATHLYGQLADMQGLLPLCREAEVPLLEDCAQAHGAMLNGQKAGGLGDLGCFSFYPTKNLGALGDGGAVTTRSASLAARVRTLRQYGWSHKYEVNTPGGRNSRLDEIQAAILREKLPYLDHQIVQRRMIAARYNRAFAKLPLDCPVSIDEDYAAHLYVIRCKQRDALRSFLLERGIHSDVHYPIPDHHQYAYTTCTQEQVLDVTESLCASVLSLPCFPGMTANEVSQTIEAVHAFFVMIGG